MGVGQSGKIKNMTTSDVAKEAQDNATPPLATEEWPNDGVEVEEEDENLAIEHPFDPEKISIATKSPTIDLIVSRINENEID